jgi:hypothetical protein
LKRISWKWSNGEQIEKSPVPKSFYIKSNDTRHNAIQQSLDEDMFLQADFNTGYMMKYSSRDENDERLSSREMIPQCGTNPFLQPVNNDYSNNYVNDVMTRDLFLKPINTSTDKIKNKSNNDTN